MDLQAARCVSRTRWRQEGVETGNRTVAEETPVAIVHNGSTTAVLMATPSDVEELAIGFTLTEGLAELDEIVSVELAEHADGAEARVWLAAAAGARLAQRRRRMVGPTGCGLCGVESLEAAARAVRPVSASLRVCATDLLQGMADLNAAQVLGSATRAVHAAGFWVDGHLQLVREDVGRHNALDKLVGGLARGAMSTEGLILLTSRVSVEMVQKTAAAGAPVLCAVSAPTALAIRTAEAAGVTLVAVCRADGFEVFSHPGRILPDQCQVVPTR